MVVLVGEDRGFNVQIIFAERKSYPHLELFDALTIFKSKFVTISFPCEKTRFLKN